MKPLSALEAGPGRLQTNQARDGWYAAQDGQGGGEQDALAGTGENWVMRIVSRTIRSR
jgi:hypothetical protein